MPDPDRPQPSNLQRAKTTITVPSDARDRIRGNSNPTSPSQGPGEAMAGAAMGAAMGAAVGRAMSPPAGPTRGLSVRRPGGAAPAPLGMASAAPAGGSSRPSPQSGGARQDSSNRVTDFYDDYLDSYGGVAEEVPPLPNKDAAAPPQQQPRSADRVANWARNNAVPANNPNLGRSRSMAPSSYAPSSAGTLRRKTTRRTNRPARSTYYEEEEEGYASGDYDDAPFEMTKIRVKVRFSIIHHN